MIAILRACFIASRLQKEPVYEALAHQDGIHLPSSEERSEVNQRTVAQVMQRAPQVLPVQMGVAESAEPDAGQPATHMARNDKKIPVQSVSRKVSRAHWRTESGDRLPGQPGEDSECAGMFSRNSRL